MLIDKELALVEAMLKEAVKSDVALLTQMGEYIFRSGGKRLRPQVVLLSYLAAGGEDATQAVPLAAAVELLHTASLVHDDINDRSDQRRGQETVNARWGTDLAILTGDFIFVKMLNLVNTFELKVRQQLTDCCAAIIEGETLQAMNRGNTAMSEDLYLEVVGKKTASLFSACAKMGAIFAAGTEQEAAALGTYGSNLGVAFQIRDDTLDLTGKTDDLGKPVTADLDQGKMSLATLFVLNSPAKARFLSAKNKTEAIKVLGEAGALEYAMHKAEEYVKRAKAVLRIFPESEVKAALCEQADFAVARNW